MESIVPYLSDCFLATLSEDEIRSGISEIFKTALIAGGSLWKDVSLKGGMCVDEGVILDIIKNKAKIVNRDYFDAGERHILNLGHTIGHAIESCSFNRRSACISHGDAVAAGLICELYLSVELLGFPKKEAEESIAFIRHLFSPVADSCFHYASLLPFLLQDKKNKKGELIFSLLKSPGEPVLNVKCDEKQIKESLKYYQKVYKKKAE
ncbi:MAG: hypothetical protein CVU05_13680 [Bacteroidetes bacterium HGW-Bacteroidetes-21]|nr:MAG: hypothetical protein CVU05_13680 [Bacteroidetes bacterium HGW-Bacteroidetes-21]